MNSGCRADSIRRSLATDREDGSAKVIFGLDQGIVVLMIENYRSQLIWKLMRRCPYIKAGLSNANFRGGWL